MTPLTPLIKGGIGKKNFFYSQEHQNSLAPSPYQGEGWGGVLPRFSIDCTDSTTTMNVLRRRINPETFVIIPLPSLWGETLISRWLKWRKFVNFSETDERAL